MPSDTPANGQSALPKSALHQQALTSSAKPAVAGWTGRDLVLGSALVVYLAALFLPWFGIVSGTGDGAIDATANGPTVHGYLWFAFALALVALAVLAAGEALGRVRANLPTATQVLVGAAFVDFGLAVLAVAVRPPGFTVTGWSYGGFVAAVAAAVAFGAAISVLGPVRSAGDAAGRLVLRAAHRPTWPSRPREAATRGTVQARGAGRPGRPAGHPRHAPAAGGGLAAIGFGQSAPAGEQEIAGEPGPAEEPGPATT